MQANWASAVVAWSLLGCAAGASPVSGDEPAAHRHLQEIRTSHTSLEERLHASPAEDLASCRLTSDDCALQVSEGRAKLVSTFRLNPCDEHNDPEAKSACVTAQLDSAGHVRELTEYLGLENWCLRKLLDCTGALAEKARLAGVERRFEQRRAELESMPSGRTARDAAATTLAQVTYLRSTLPPAGTDICPPAVDAQACTSRAEGERKHFDESLRGDAYDANAALSRYEALKHLEASCSAPELECLSDALPRYGVFPESRKWVERNFALLAERQQLAAQLAADQGTECLDDLQAAHQANIVAAYVPYAREPVLYFRTQLDKAFLSLHQAQVACLTSKRKAAKPVSTATAAR